MCWAYDVVIGVSKAHDDHRFIMIHEWLNEWMNECVPVTGSSPSGNIHRVTQWTVWLQCNVPSLFAVTKKPRALVWVATRATLAKSGRTPCTAFSSRTYIDIVIQLTIMIMIMINEDKNNITCINQSRSLTPIYTISAAVKPNAVNNSINARTQEFKHWYDDMMAEYLNNKCIPAG
jgi:hypothetical protein